jgi:CBS domain-containing protein
MTCRPVTITGDTSLAEVERIFEAHDFNCLPVCEDGALVGIVTKLDLLKAFAFTPDIMAPHYEEIIDRPAASVMTSHPITTDPEMHLTRVLELMVETRFKSFPVVTGTRLLGIVAREDVLRALRHAAAGERPRGGEGKPGGRRNT